MPVKTQKVTCPRCEGTGNKLNTFDPPDERYVPFGMYATGEVPKELIIVDNNKYSPSGREIYDEICNECQGRRYIHILAD